MIRLLASLIIGIMFFLGNISSQAKSYKLIDHVATFHHHDHHNHHSHEESKNTKKHHHHDAELSSLNLQLGLSTQGSFTKIVVEQFVSKQSYLTINQLNLQSFSPSIFRPPIS